jgi:hypothetical protein
MSNMPGKGTALLERLDRRLPGPAAARLDLIQPTLRLSWGGPLNGQAVRQSIVREVPIRPHSRDEMLPRNKRRVLPSIDGYSVFHNRNSGKILPLRTTAAKARTKRQRLLAETRGGYAVLKLTNHRQ